MRALVAALAALLTACACGDYDGSPEPAPEETEEPWPEPDPEPAPSPQDAGPPDATGWPDAAPVGKCQCSAQGSLIMVDCNKTNQWPCSP